MTLSERLRALEEAVATGAGRLIGEVREAAQTVLDRAGDRRELSVEHTVVALGGATGSGKSSLFNFVTGMDVSPVGVRRPTTSDPIACVWGTQGVVPLLDWLGVPPHHQVSRESVLDSGEADDLDGLVLLDLPDHDSTEKKHQVTVDRVVELVDLFVWVLDPQKYADAAVHDRYLRPLSSHQTVTVVVLNQIDRLSRQDVVECVTDLRRRLEEDGLDHVPVVALSAVTGEGVDTLVDLIRTAVTKRRAVDERIEADVRMTAGAAVKSVGEGRPGEVGAPARQRLVGALVEACAIDAVAQSAGRDYLRRARAATGWPPARWLARLRSDPAERFGATPGDEPEAAVTTSGLPVALAVQRARSDAVVREFGDTAAGTLPGAWRDSVRDTAASSAARLPEALDDAVAATDFAGDHVPRWWRVAGAVQWLALVCATGGALWLLAMASTPLHDIDVTGPEVAGVPVAAVLLVVGVVAGILLALGCLVPARRGSRQRADWVDRKLRDLIDRTAVAVVIEPVTAELDRYRAFRRALERARSQ